MLYRRLIKRVLPVVSALRSGRYHFGFLLCASVLSEVGADHFCSAEKDKSRFVRMGKDDEASFKIEVSDGLLLYYDRFSFYSQKVVMALHEKNLSFDSRIINLFTSEHYSPWFLHLNPRGEVPVLQDTGKIIPDSSRIIDYLEDNFSNGGTPRLIPMDQGPVIRQKVTHFRHLLQNAPQGKLTTGAMLNQDLLRNPKTPFVGPVRKALANAEINGARNLRECAEKNPQHKAVLLKKAEDKEAMIDKLSVESHFREVLEQIQGIFDEVEAELTRLAAENKSDWWLCSDRFTIADVELTVLLIRISQLGLDYMFWGPDKRPHIASYYGRVQSRDSYKKTVPGTLVLLKTILLAQAPLIVGVVAAVALLVGGAIIAKKYS